MFNLPPQFANGDPNQPKQIGPREIERRRALANALLRNSESTAPIQHWMQGASRVVDAGIGSHMQKQLDQQERSGMQSRANGMMNAFGGPNQQPRQPQQPMFGQPQKGSQNGFLSGLAGIGSMLRGRF